ncbi:MAG: RNA polymerase sigma factor [Acidobacteriota bacterium]
MRRAVLGDDRAFSAWVELHWSRWVSLARSVTGDLEAEDAVQDALIRAWDRLHQLKEPEAAASWVTSIVVRSCLRRTRWRLRIPLFGGLFEDVPEKGEESDPGPRLDVETMLGKLAPRQRLVLHLTAVEGMSDREIGTLMDIDSASVRSHRRRARQRLDRLFGGEQR